MRGRSLLLKPCGSPERCFLPGEPQDNFLALTPWFDDIWHRVTVTEMKFLRLLVPRCPVQCPPALPSWLGCLGTLGASRAWRGAAVLVSSKPRSSPMALHTLSLSRGAGPRSSCLYLSSWCFTDYFQAPGGYKVFYLL